MDYRVKINIRNNRILKAIEEKGYRSTRQFCMSNGLGYQRVVEIINGRKKPLKENGTLSKCVINLLDQLNLNIENAFTERQLQGFKKHSFQMEMSESQLASISSAPTKNAELSLMEKDVNKVLNTLMTETLKPREEKIIRGYYFENKNTEDSAKEFGITRARVDQIIKKSLFKLSSSYKKFNQSGIKDVFPKVGDKSVFERADNSGNLRYVIRKRRSEKQLNRKEENGQKART